MTAHRILLFRGMNIGGIRAGVGEQRAMATDLGLGNPRTLLASGNLVVESEHDPRDLEAAVEAETERRFGRRIDTVVRTDVEWNALIAANPFPSEAVRDPARLLAVVMKAGIKAGGLKGLRALAVGDERVEAVEVAGGSTLFCWHPNGIGDSAMAAKAVPRLIGVGTGRNWNTVLKLAAMAGVDV
ncbi:DUF1697 domain-containing protein [soil metagenome]